MIDIIFFAIIAVVLFVKLNRILGEEYENDVPKNTQVLKDITDITKRHEETKEEVLLYDANIIDKNTNAIFIQTVQGKFSDITPAAFMNVTISIINNLATSYTSGNIEDMKPLLNETIYNSFFNAIEDRVRNQITEYMSIIKIHTAKIISVVDVNDCITVVVGLESSQIHYKKDKNNNVISGSMDKVISIKEEWSFVQKKSVNTPQWLICEIKTISNE